MPHATKINAIFVHIKAGDRSIPVHNDYFKIFLENSKNVTGSTKEEAGNRAPVLFFILSV